MKKTKEIIFNLFFICVPVMLTSAQENEPIYDPIWFIFADEMELFIEKSQSLYDRGLLTQTPETTDQVDELLEISRRIAGIYFEELEAEVRPDLDAYLALTLKEHEHLDAFFILLGNGFYERAEIFITDQKNKHSQIRRWSVAGGMILGLATGGGILYFKPNLVNGAIQKGLLVVGLGAAGAGIGYGAGYVSTNFVMKADPGVENAIDFIERYPTGTDFIDEYRNVNQDIAGWKEEMEGFGG